MQDNCQNSPEVSSLTMIGGVDRNDRGLWSVGQLSYVVGTLAVETLWTELPKLSAVVGVLAAGTMQNNGRKTSWSVIDCLGRQRWRLSQSQSEMGWLSAAVVALVTETTQRELLELTRSIMPYDVGSCRQKLQVAVGQLSCVVGALAAETMWTELPKAYRKYHALHGPIVMAAIRGGCDHWTNCHAVSCRQSWIIDKSIV